MLQRFSALTACLRKLKLSLELCYHMKIQRYTFETCSHYAFSKESLTEVQETTPKITKYSSLVLHSKAHHKKKDWHFRNCVGSKALRHYKVRLIKSSHVYYTCTTVIIFDYRGSVRGTKAVHAQGKNTISTLKANIRWYTNHKHCYKKYT